MTQKQDVHGKKFFNFVKIILCFVKKYKLLLYGYVKNMHENDRLTETEVITGRSALH